MSQAGGTAVIHHLILLWPLSVLILVWGMTLGLVLLSGPVRKRCAPDACTSISLHPHAD